MMHIAWYSFFHILKHPEILQLLQVLETIKTRFKVFSDFNQRISNDQQALNELSPGFDDEQN